MPELPWVVAPKRQTRIVSATVNGEECSLELPTFGAWLTDEEIRIAEHQYQSAVYAESSRLADALVAAGTPELDAQRIATRIVSTRLGIPVALGDDEQRAMLRHADLIASITNCLAEESQQQTLRVVAAAISIRVNGCASWEEALTMAGTFPGPLQRAIAAFMDEERYGGLAKDPEEIVAAMAETLVMLAPPVDSSQPPPTGPSVSGDASDSGLVTPPSAASGSGGSRSPSSSKRSRKASAG